MHFRRGFSSAVRGDAVLLIGGESTHTTELISINGSPARPGPFNVTRHRDRHCTIYKISAWTIVVTGGGASENVTEYHLDDGSETPMTSLLQGREDHACGFYLNNNNQQVGGDIVVLTQYLILVDFRSVTISRFIRSHIRFSLLLEGTITATQYIPQLRSHKTFSMIFSGIDKD